MDTEQKIQLSAELKQKVSELVSHFARTHQTRIGRRYEYRGFNHAIIEHSITDLLATELQRVVDAQDDIRRNAFNAGYSWRTPAFESEIRAAYAEYLERLEAEGV